MATKTNKTATRIQFNKEKGGIEVFFGADRQLTNKEKDIIGSNGIGLRRFRQDPNNKWYIRYSEEKLDEIMASFIGAEVGHKRPSKKDAEVTAAKREELDSASALKRKASKASGTTKDRLSEVEAQQEELMKELKQLTVLCANMAKAVSGMMKKA